MELIYSINIDNGFKVYEVPTTVCVDMLDLVEKTRANSFPKPNKVASIALSPGGQKFEGVSYHTEIMSLTMHAEATALAHAAIHGVKEVVAITGPNCHACKQLIWEHALRSKIDILIIMKKEGGLLKLPISSMMQYAWPENSDYFK